MFFSGRNDFCRFTLKININGSVKKTVRRDKKNPAFAGFFQFNAFYAFSNLSAATSEAAADSFFIAITIGINNGIIMTSINAAAM